MGPHFHTRLNLIVKLFAMVQIVLNSRIGNCCYETIVNLMICEEQIVKIPENTLFPGENMCTNLFAPNLFVLFDLHKKETAIVTKV